MTLAINVKNVAKKYRLGTTRAGQYRTLRESLTASAAAAARAVARLGRGGAIDPKTELWALDDLSFNVRPGEALGVIGRNGAGKSTLLKILSRITSPTRGSVEIRGRVGSLLEVGTGFHPELTGRENVFLNGAILGMSRREITRKFDEIVEFSEVAKFIDTPVKRYSSGMYVRLAFAVAAHMEPDILLIDEVLSVGDLAFQRKCMDHAKRMLKRDVTLLLVSHNMFAIKSLCDRAIYLSRGKLVGDGPVETVAGQYDQESRLDVAAWAQSMVGSDPTKCPIHITRLEIVDEAGQERTIFQHGDRVRMRLHYHAKEPVALPNFNVAFVRSDGVACCTYSSKLDGFPTGQLRGDGAIELTTAPLKLISEMYSVYVMIWDPTFSKLYCAQQAGDFHVRDELLSTEFGVFHEPAQWEWSEPAIPVRAPIMPMELDTVR
jgi:lipopolysaccharide transport system ATP-binding protein